MDVYLAIASKRDERRYDRRALPDDAVNRILDAGRLAGSARNRQPWEFVVVADATDLAKAVYAPDNLLGAALVVAILGRAGLSPDCLSSSRARRSTWIALELSRSATSALDFFAIS